MPIRGIGERRLQRVALALIVLGALGLRLALTLGERVVWGDEPFYLWLGRNWITGQGFGFLGHADVHHGPLYPMLAGAAYLATGDLAQASELLYVLLGGLLVLPVYGIGRLLYGRGAGLIAAALTAAWPALTAAVLHWGTLTEPLYLLLVYVGLWAALRVAHPLAHGQTPRATAWPLAVAGLAFGLAYLTRPEAFLYVLIVGAYLLALGLWAGAWRRACFWLGLLLLALGFAAAYVPYGSYVRQHTGAWMVSEKVGVAYLTGVGLARGDTAAFDRSTWGLDSTGLETFFFSSESYTVSMTQLILEDPRTFLGVLYLNAQTLGRVLIDWTLYPYVLLPLVALGLFGRGWTRGRALTEAYLALSAAPVLSFVLFFIQARYLVAFLPVLILWASAGLAHLGAWLEASLDAIWRPTRHRRLWVHVVPTLAVVALLLAMHPTVLARVTSVGSVRMDHKRVGEWLAPRVSPETVIMSRYPAIAFHADARWVPTPNAELPAVLRYARHKGAAYWVVDAHELRYRPQFAELLARERPIAGLKRVPVDADVADDLAVYRVME
ncbi:MAG: glycosyltransferase family 39 protein [Chloroflexota bacterium]